MERPCSSTSPPSTQVGACVNTLQTLSVRRIVQMLFMGAAEGGQDEYLEDVLGVVQNLGLFTDVFYHGMRYLQVQYELQRSGEKLGVGGTINQQPGKQAPHSRRRSSSTSLALECVISRLLPGLLHPKLTVLSLKYDFVRHSAHARAITLTSICRLRNLEKADLSGVCTDELCAQISLHCPRLRHLCANGSKQLTDHALTALAGALRVGGEITGGGGGMFLPGCKKLRRLEIAHCPLITASKVVSILLTLPDINYIASDKLPQTFESSALFESGLTFGLTNFEHVVTHLERAREKINHHLKSEDQFLLKVSEIFPRISSVKLVLSHLFDDTTILRQLSHFNHIHTLVLEQPVGGLDWNLREFLLEMGHRLAKLSLRVHSASLLDLVWIFRSCPRLKIFRFFAMVLDSALGELSPQWPSQFLSTDEDDEEVRLTDLAELCLGCAKTFHINLDDEDNNGQHQNHQNAVDNNNNNQEGGGGEHRDNINNNQPASDDIFLDLFVSLLLQAKKLRSLVLSGACSNWASDQTVGALIEAGALAYLRRIVITSKTSLSPSLGKRLHSRCPELHQMRVFGWNNGNSSSNNGNSKQEKHHCQQHQLPINFIV